MEAALMNHEDAAFTLSQPSPLRCFGVPDWSNEHAMSTTPLLSIGLFLYNGERFLEAAIDSILNQTFQDFELIISDNCSTDRSEEICRVCGPGFPHSLLPRRKQHGRRLEPEECLFQGHRQVLQMGAHDDMIQPDFLRLCVDALEADDSLVVAHTLTRASTSMASLSKTTSGG
jgi:hypothetical protein